MDWIIGLLILFVLFGGPRIVLRMIANSGSSRTNPPLLSRAPTTLMQLSDDFEPTIKMPCKRVHFKGSFPVTEPTQISFVLSALDVTDGKTRPCLFPIDAFQEKKTMAFQSIRHFKSIASQGDYLKEWIEVGIIFHTLLKPPFGGSRKIQATLRLIQTDKQDIVHLGTCKPGATGLIWEGRQIFEFNFTEKGYEEEKQHLREASILAITLAMAISSADGCFDEEEGEVVQGWIERHINSAPAGEKESLKQNMNAAVNKAYEDAMNSGIQTALALTRLNEIGDKSSKFEALELSFEVMSADGKMCPEELVLLKAYADFLNIPKQEFERLKDLHTLGINVDDDVQMDDERLLGLDASMDLQAKLSILRKEFRKWNSRMATLTDPDQRNVAQHRLDMIGRIRHKYDLEASELNIASSIL